MTRNNSKCNFSTISRSKRLVQMLALVLLLCGPASNAFGATDSIRQQRSGKTLIAAGIVSLTANAANAELGLGQLLEQANGAVAANPDDLTAKIDRAEFRLASGDGAGACADAIAVLNSPNVPEQTKSRAVIIAHFGFLRNKKMAESKAILLQSRDRCNHDVWPYAIIACLAGDMSEQQLIDKAKVERARELETRLFLGYRELLSGRLDDAWRDFEWVERNANPFWRQMAFAELVRIDPHHYLPLVDFQDYVARLQDRLRSCWRPPALDENRRVGVRFTVHSDGKVSHVAVTKSSGSSRLDEAGLATVWSAAPFSRLPQGSPDEVDIDFHFECNVVK